MYDRVDVLQEFAEHLAAQGAQVIWNDRLRAAGGPLRGTRSRTSTGNLITQGVIDTEHRIRERVAYHRPHDAVLSEMTDGHRVVDEQVTWLVAPVSGTSNYIHGLPTYGVSVAALLDNTLIAGAVAEPHSRRLWSAGLGQGARLHDPAITDNWLEIRVGSTWRLHEAVIGTNFASVDPARSGQAELVTALLPTVAGIRSSGSAAVELCHVAAGWLDAYVQHGLDVCEWAAGLLIAEEAGAIVHRPGPAASPGEPVYASTPRISDALRDALERASAGRLREADPPCPTPASRPQRTA